MAAIQILGTDYSNDVTGIDELELTVQDNSDTKTLAINFSDTNLEFRGAAYDLLEDYFFLSEKGCLKKLPVKISFSCCGRGKFYDFEILSAEVNIMPCKKVIEAQVSFVTPENDYYFCLKSNPVLGNRFDENNLLEVSFTHSARTALNGNFAETQNEQPTILSYFNEVARACGMTFKSDTVLTGDYAGAVYFIGFGFSRLRVDDPIKRLDNIAAFFGAEWRITKNGEIRLEKEGYFDNEIIATIDLEQAYQDGCLEECPSYGWDDENLCAFASFVHEQEDGQSEVARNDYDNYIDWTDADGTAQTGECRFDIPFVPSQFLPAPGTPSAIRTEYLDIGKPHMIFWDGQPHTSNAQVVTTTNLSGDIIYNHLAHYSEDYKSVYLDFFAEKRPTETCNTSLEDVTYYPPNFCEFLDTVIEEGTNIKLTGPYGEYIPKTINLNIKEKTVTFSDILTII